MSIANEITRLQQAKSDLATSITNKGVTVPSSATLDDYAALVDSIPAGSSSLYDAEIEYIQSSGTQYIDLIGVLNSEVDIIDIKFKLISQVSATSGLFGARVDASTKNFSVLVASSNSIIIDVNNGSYATYRVNSGSTGYNKLCEVHLQKDAKTIKFDGTQVASSYASSQVFATTSNAMLFKIGEMPSPSVRIYSLTWKRTGVGWIYNFKPVRKGQTGYLYDSVHNILFGNSGTGSFTLGPDVT